MRIIVWEDSGDLCDKCKKIIEAGENIYITDSYLHICEECNNKQTK